MQTHEDAHARRSGTYPAAGSLTPTQRVLAVAPVVRISAWDRASIAALGAYTLLIAAWLASGSQRITEWRTFAVLATLTVVLASLGMAVRAALTPELDRGSRNFWALMALVHVIIVAGTFFKYFAGANHPALVPLAQLWSPVLPQPLILLALLQLPSAPRFRVEKLRYWLDVATVLVGGLLVLWYDVRTPEIAARINDWRVLALAHGAVIGQVVLLLTATVLWRRTRATVLSNVLLLVSLALLLGFLRDVATVLELRNGIRLNVRIVALSPISACFVAAAAWLQRTAARTFRLRSTTVSPGSQSITIIPYLAILPGVALLLRAANEQGLQPLGGLALGAVMLTGLAFARQMVSNRENVRILAESKAKESEARFRALVQHSSDVITIVDTDSTIRYVSPSVATVFGHEPRQLLDTRLVDLLHPDDLHGALQFLNEIAQTPPVSSDSSDAQLATLKREWRLLHSKGRWLTVDTVGTNLLDEPMVQGLVLNSRDVTERRVIEEQYMHQAFHDPLTDLANRSLFLYQVGHALARGTRHSLSATVLFLDLDNFKTVNDSLGHAAGDLLLIDAARRLAACVRDSDLIARLGGDEFAVLVEDAPTETEILQMAERIAKALSNPFVLNGKEVFVSASIGIARTFPGDTSDELVRNADVAMYIAKTRGKGRYVLFEPEMHSAALKRLDTEADLHKALARDEFYLEYQPIVMLETGEVVGAEALLRWRRKDGGTVPPTVFIPIAEDTGLIMPIGRWVLHAACRTARKWESERGFPLRVTVNLSSRQLQDEHIVEDVQNALSESGFSARHLVLEITESILMQHTDVSLERLHKLKALGVSLAIDDFGTGYSSLSYLQRYPIDILKIDKAFVDTIDKGDDGAVLATAIVALGETLRLDTVAEGIETDAQRGHLLQLGCELGQGYLFAPALPAEDFSRLLVARGARELKRARKKVSGRAA